MLFLCIETLLHCLYPQFDFTPLLVIGGAELLLEMFFGFGLLYNYNEKK